MKKLMFFIKRRSKVNNFILMSTAFLIFWCNNTYAFLYEPSYYNEGGFTTALYKNSHAWNNLKNPVRLFQKQAESSTYQSTVRRLDKTVNSNISLTKDDLLNAYSLENELEFYYTDDEASFEMNIGTRDLINPQNWVIPVGLIKEEKPGVGIRVSDSPFAQAFPEATHCKRYYYEVEEDYYEYYAIKDEEAVLIGIGVNYLDEEETEIDTLDYLMTPLDLNLNTVFEMEATINLNTRTLKTEQNIEPYGFGTLTTPDGDLEVIAFKNTCYLYKANGDSVLKDETETIITFVDKKGNRFDAAIEQGAPESGETDIDWMEYTHIVYNATDVEQKEVLPVDFALYQNYPNPFNPSTTIRYVIPAFAGTSTGLSAGQAGSASANVTLKIYDILGNLVATLQDGPQAPGYYERTWNLPDRQAGARDVSSGIYLSVLKAGNFSKSNKMILLK